MDCGPACLAMIADFYGKKYSLQFLRDNSFLSKEGVSMAGIHYAAQKIGLNCSTFKIKAERLKAIGELPCILHWNKNHFVVLYQIKKVLGKTIYKIADPGYGRIKLSEFEFYKSWINETEEKGIVMLLKPSEEFYELKENQTRNIKFSQLFNYIVPFKHHFFQIIVALLATSLFTLAFPFLTKALIDDGIKSKSLNIVFLILLGQVVIFLGSTAIDVIRNWITFNMSSRINILIISSFLSKILMLPIRFFDSKMRGDFTQRIQDHERIESFLNSQSLITIFSFINFIVFLFVLFYYDVFIVATYLGCTIIAIVWLVSFLRKRKILDYNKFMVKSEGQESVFELINGIQEIKLNGLEDYKRENWEKVRFKLFKINSRVLQLDQVQVGGFNFINQLKNIFVTYISARAVITGNLTLGEMLSISYIIGQMNSPINQMVSFFRSLQDAKLSIERLNEIQNQDEEELPGQKMFDPGIIVRSGIRLENISFRYGSPLSPIVLQDISVDFEAGKTTAIVGASGSGKTTLMKLLLGLYIPEKGTVSVNETLLSAISPHSWRAHCGIVMQDGYIFSDTIERNIAGGDEIIDTDRLKMAVSISNLGEFVEILPLGLETKIGASGNGLSGGQRQRILIARAIYKAPKYVLLDEATSALDAENENKIHKGLQSFFSGKTVIIIAHRLSTVKNADKIIVLKNGRIIEMGNHHELIREEGEYYKLIKNQLELGK